MASSCCLAWLPCDMGHKGLLQPSGHLGLLKASQKAIDTKWGYLNILLVVRHNYLLSAKDYRDLKKKSCSHQRNVSVVNHPRTGLVA